MVFGNRGKCDHDTHHFYNHNEFVMKIQDELRKYGQTVYINKNIVEYWSDCSKKCYYNVLDNVLHDARISNDNLLRSAQVKFRIIPIHSDPKPFYRVFLDVICCQSTNINLEVTFYLEHEDESIVNSQ